MPVLMNHKDFAVVYRFAGRLLEDDLFLVKDAIEYVVLDVSEPIEGDFGFGVVLGDDEGLDDDLVEVEVLAEVVEVTVVVQQVARRDFAEVVGGVVVVSVDCEYRQSRPHLV